MEQSKLNKKVQKEFPEFADEVLNLPEADLIKRITTLAQGARANDESKKADAQLQGARSDAKVFAAPYNDFKKAVKLKTTYILNLLEDRKAG